MSSLQHIAIIMDGNGRWAQTRNKDRTFGHLRGAFAAKKVITAAVKNNIPYLTLFAFSTENWQRPEKEVLYLIRLLHIQILREQKQLMKQNIRFNVIGDIHRFPESIVAVVNQTIEMTKNNTGLVLTFGLNYSGQQDILKATLVIAEKLKNAEICSEEINAELFRNHLPSNSLPDPDLIIRTSGESRLSNFMLWQSAYSELYFTNVLWPDFAEHDFEESIRHFYNRSRRFGCVNTSAAEITL
jgi:undecaprenyl diphosphate synthase